MLKNVPFMAASVFSLAAKTLVTTVESAAATPNSNEPAAVSMSAT